ncbi:hypothetical protein LJB89_04530, partial [Tyzzerella sp. OttesenSCG-928-J15]|nr:hypothetical protein [Tyzzerella sp. OttesenSCG-928-J15]
MTISLGIEIAIINLETIVFVHLINNSLPPKRFSQLAIMLMLCGLQTLHRVLMIEVGLLSIVPSLLFDSAVVFFGYDGELRKKIFLIVLFYSLSIVFDASSEL